MNNTTTAYGEGEFKSTTFRGIPDTITGSSGPTVYRTEYDAHKEKTISMWVGIISLWIVFWGAYYLGSIHWLF